MLQELSVFPQKELLNHSSGMKDLKDRSDAFSFRIYFFQILDSALIFVIVTNKDFEIFQLSEMTEHGTFTIVS